MICQECRGLVLRTAQALGGMDVVVGNTDILALPMKRFFNYGQAAAAPVDFNSPDTRFCEKLDGTLCIVYWDPDLSQSCVGTRSVPDADLTMDGFGNQTFSDLFWKAYNATLSRSGFGRSVLNIPGYDLFTFCFELCTPDNQVVVKYNDYSVYLLAVRNTLTGQEDLPETWASGLGTPAAPTYKFGSTAEMLDFVSSRNPLAHEGIVVCDKNFNRVKVKNAGYLAYNKIKDSVAKSPRAVLEIVLLGKEDDVYPLVGENVQKFMTETKEGLQRLLVRLDEEYTRSWSADRKAFALAIQAGSGFMGPQMGRWSGKCQNAHDWIMTNRKNGSWSDGFLDTLLRMVKE